MGPNNTNDQQTTEVRETTPAPAPPTYQPAQHTTTTRTAHSAVPPSVLASRIVYYLGGALVILLALRFVLALLGANRANPFADFIFGLSYPFVYPFFGLFSFEPSYGAVSLELGTLVAIVVYGIATIGVAKLLTLGRPDA